MCLSQVVMLFLVLLQACSSATYYTYGNNQMFADEGFSVQSISGYKSVIDISSKECAEGCLSLNEQCSCCDSFTYNTFTRECYLKIKDSSDSSSSTRTFYNYDGWQSYTLVPSFGSITVDDNVQALQDKLVNQSSAYMHKGFNQIAVDEGIYLLTKDGKEFLVQVTPDDCAEECNRVDYCNSFDYNPDKYGGSCFLMWNTDRSRATTYSSQNWRTYWSDSTDDCFCTCKNNNFCVICVFDDVCFER